MIRTLSNLSDLRKSCFGQPHPRHGLNLLWWFAQNCVRIDSNGQMIAKCDPENGAFGFDQFYNRENLLPDTNLPYYEVGNLNPSYLLPDYVTKNYTGLLDDSNTDRIIVSFDSSCNRFENIYVTQHSDLTNFDQNHTYHIGLDLLKDIQELTLNNFLTETFKVSYQIYFQGHCKRTAQSVENEPYQSQKSNLSIKNVCAKCCRMLCIFLLIFTVLTLLSIMKI